MQIPVIYLRDKQAFRKDGGVLRIAGKPIDIAKGHKSEGRILIHIVDFDAQKGSQANIDIYDNLTFIINVQVECAPDPALVMKLLSLKCRVVLPPSFDTSAIAEKRLLVAKIPAGYEGDAEGFHDVLLEDADEARVRRFGGLGKRVLIYEKDRKKVKSKVFGVISSS